MKLLMKHINLQKKLLFYYFIVISCVVILQLWQPFLLKEGIRMILFGTREEIWGLEAKIFILGSGIILLEIINAFFAVNLSRKIGASIREQTFENIQKVPLTTIENLTVSGLSSRLTQDINQIQNLLMITFQMLIKTPFLIMSALYFSCKIFPEYSWQLIFSGLFLGVFSYGIAKFSIRSFAKMTQSKDQMMHKIRENFKGIRLVKNYGQEANQLEKISFNSKKSLKEYQVIGIFNGVINATIYLFVNLGMLVALNFISNYIVTEVEFSEKIFLFTLFLLMIITEITKSVGCNSLISLGLQSLKNLNHLENQVLPTQQTAKESFLVKSGEIEFSDVGFTFPNQQRMLKKLNLKIESGSFIGIVGLSGVGKTTLAKLLAGLYQPTQGEIFVGGNRLAELNQTGRIRNLAYVSQKGGLFSGTIAENIRMGKPDASETEILEALEMAQILEFVNTLEMGIETVISEGSNNFSGGQKQRLAIARGLIGQPKILILDDSLSALDFQTEKRVMTSLESLRGKTTIILISQKITSFIKTDQYLLLKNQMLIDMAQEQKPTLIFQEVQV